jgi:hypothetical protein
MTWIQSSKSKIDFGWIEKFQFTTKVNEEEKLLTTMIMKPQNAKVTNQSSKQLKLHNEGYNHKYFIQLKIFDWTRKYTAMKDRKIGYYETNCQLNCYPIQFELISQSE